MNADSTIPLPPGNDATRFSAPQGDTGQLALDIKPRNYAVEGTHARGGMGAILSAKDLNLGRTVAMKVVLRDRQVSQEQLLRFVEEAKVTGQLEHPNIVPVHELATDEQGEPYYIMKFVQGVTLKDVLGDLKAGKAETATRYTLAHLLTIFQKVCDAVAFAHSKSVVHRDLKPENVMIGEYGEVLVMDWGLAKVLKAAEQWGDGGLEGCAQSSSTPALQSPAGLTLDGTIMGTPNFMAPEQAEGRIGDIDARTDVFALGGILYNILTLHAPVEAASVEEALEKVRRGDITPASQYNPTTHGRKPSVAKTARAPLLHCPGLRIPESLAAVAMKAMAVRREDRYQGVPELQQEIAAYQGGFATAAERAGVVRLLWLLVQRHKTEFGLGVATLIVLVAVVAVSLIRIAGERNAAIRERNRADATLGELRGAAPSFYAEAATLLRQRNFTNALRKVDYAISLRPDVADHHWLRGNVLESLLQLGPARDAYGRALQINPNHKLARANLDLCSRLARANTGRTTLDPTSLQALYDALCAEGRWEESAAVAEHLTDSAERLLAAWKPILQKAGLDVTRFSIEPKGGLNLELRKAKDLAALRGVPLSVLRLSGTEVKDLEPLRGMQLTALELDKTLVQDLGPLRGMPLQRLSASKTQVTDLTALTGAPLRMLNLSETKVVNLDPLKGMPLTDLNLSDTAVDNISALAGMPLIKLNLEQTRVADLTPLRGLPLTELVISRTQVSDLEPLRGMALGRLALNFCPCSDLEPLRGAPLQSLSAQNTLIADLRPLTGMQLRSLWIAATPVNDLSPVGIKVLQLVAHGCANLRDLSPLAKCTNLELLSIPSHCRDIEFLRRLPNLKVLCYGWDTHHKRPLTSAAEFWKRYDAGEFRGTNATANADEP